MELEPSCQMMALPSTAPDANILEFLDEYKQSIADLGLAFCFFIKLWLLHMYKYPSDPPVIATSFMKITL